MKSVIKNAAFAFVMCFVGMAGAQAGPTGEPQLVVSYGDLDLSGKFGARVLISRLDVAASQVCGGAPVMRDLERTALYRACKHQAMDNAVASVGSPTVSAIYGGGYLRLASRR
jgi:UrcA family protein